MWKTDYLREFSKSKDHYSPQNYQPLTKFELDLKLDMIKQYINIKSISSITNEKSVENLFVGLTDRESAKLKSPSSSW